MSVAVLPPATPGVPSARRAARQREFRVMLAASQGFALLWWGVALAVRRSGLVPVWYDQATTFTQTWPHLLDPYSVTRFANPPWVAWLLAPFGWLPLELAVLLQLGLLLGALVAVVYRYGGGWRGALAVLAGFLAFVNALELNIEWLVAVGLLLPPAASAPFLLAKPQVALGVAAAWAPRQWLAFALVALALGALAWLLVGNWPAAMLSEARSVQAQSAGYNAAPLALMPWPFALALGTALALWALRRRDALLGVLAGLCFMPYVAFYSLIVPLALLAARVWWAAALASALMWALYGGLVLLALLTR